MDALHDFAAKYLTLRENKLAALAQAAEADGDQELADLYFQEAERKLEILKPDLQVVIRPDHSNAGAGTPAACPRQDEPPPAKRPLVDPLRVDRRGVRGGAEVVQS